MNQAIFHSKRMHYGQDDQKRETTLATMFDPEGKEFCKVLEDVVRAYGIKRMKTTAIPATEGDFTYHLSTKFESGKYGKVVTVYTHTENRAGIEVPVLEYNGIRFELIRAHGGNSADDTDACMLVNKYWETADGKMKAWQSMKEEFANKVEELENKGFDVRLRVSNMPQRG